jgi:hypothetical protein
MFRLNEINDFASFFTDVAMASGDKLYFDGGTHTYISEVSDDRLDFVVGSDTLLKLDEANNKVIVPQSRLIVSGSDLWSTGGQGGSTDNVVVLQLGRMIDSPSNPLVRFYADDNLDMLEYNILRYAGKHRFTRGSSAGGRVNMMTVEGNSTTQFKLWHQSNVASQTGSAVIYLNASTGSSAYSEINSGGGLEVSGDVSGSLTSTGSFGHITGFNLGTGNVGIDMNNTDIKAINNLQFNDDGPGEGLQWGTWKIFSSPHDLSTNSGGSLQFVSASVGSIYSRTFSVGRPHKINTGATYFRPTGSGNFAIISGSDGAFLMLDSNHSTADKQVGGIYWNHTQGNADAHIHLAGIATYHESHATAGLGGGNLLFFTKNAGSNPGVAPRAVFRHNGTFGFGVTEPSHKFEINSAGNTNSTLRIDADDGRGANRYALDIQDDDSNNRGTARIRHTGGSGKPTLIFADTYDHGRILTSRNTSASDAEQLIIEHFDGNVAFRNPRGDMQISSSMQFKDSVQLRIGNGNDTLFYHDGSNTYLDNTGANNFIIQQSGDDRDLIFKCDDGSGGVASYITLDGSAALTQFDKNTKHSDSIRADFGNSSDFRIYHDGSNSSLENHTGALYIDNHADDQDIIFRTDDGGTGAAEVLRIDASDNGRIKIPNDNQRLAIGASDDIQITHDGSNSYFDNYTGHLNIKNNATDKDIILLSDDGSGGETAYLTLDGSATAIKVAKNLEMADSVQLRAGAGDDLKIYHDGSNSYIIGGGTGNLIISQQTDDADIILKSDNGSGGTANYLVIDGGANAIDLLQDTRVKAAKKLYLDGGGNTYIHEQSADDVEIVVGGDVLAKFENDTIVLGGGYAVSSSLAFFGQPESPKHMAYGQFTVASEGWYRIARCGTVADGADNGTRASAKFTVYDTDSSRHSAVTFYASGHFGQNFNIRIINSSDYGGTHGVIEQIRIVHGSTYEGFGVDVYVKNNGDSAVRYVMEENYQDNGWTAENFAAQNADPPTNMAATAISCSYASSNVVDGLAHGNGTANGAVRWYRTENGVNFQSGSGGYAELKTNSRYRVVTDAGYAEFGPQNASFAHIQTDRPSFYFNKEITVDTGIISSYDENLQLQRASSTDDMISIEASEHRFIIDAVERLSLTSAGAELNNGALGVDVTPNGTDGRIDAGNDIVAFSSDKRLKQNIKFIENPLEKVSQLSGFTYNWNEKANKEAGYDMDKDYVGVFAQDVEKVQPEAVKIAPFDNDGTDNSKSGENYLTVQYEKLVPLLIESIKELKKEIEELKK